MDIRLLLDTTTQLDTRTSAYTSTLSHALPSLVYTKPSLPLVSPPAQDSAALPAPHSRSGSLYNGPLLSATVSPTQSGSNESPPTQKLKRSTSRTPLSEESPAKKQSKWSPE